MTKQQELTIENIEAGYSNDAWQGFGYLGERRNAIEAVKSGEWETANIYGGDVAALYVANEKRWSADRFFQWMNSKHGRWYGDAVFGTEADALDAARQLVK